MSEPLIPHHPDNQTLVVAALLVDLTAAGWRLAKVAQAQLDGRVFDFKSHREAVGIIQGLDIALLEFSKVGVSNQRIRLDYGSGVGREMLSDWSRLPEFDSLIIEFCSGIDARLLQAFPDTQLNIEQIQAKYEAKGGHSRFAKSDWQAEVANGDTLRGYWDWVQAKVEEFAAESKTA
jgi:hypothetical protein